MKTILATSLLSPGFSTASQPKQEPPFCFRTMLVREPSETVLPIPLTLDAEVAHCTTMCALSTMQPAI